jgi:hypothetical protein
VGDADLGDAGRDDPEDELLGDPRRWTQRVVAEAREGVERSLTRRQPLGSVWPPPARLPQ